MQSSQSVALRGLSCRRSPPRPVNAQRPGGEDVFAERKKRREEHESRFCRRGVLTGSVAAALPWVWEKGCDADDLLVERSSLISGKEVPITQKVLLEFSVCQDAVRQNRTIGDVRLCENAQSLGKLTIGLFGDRLPVTVANFLKTVEAGAYNETIVDRIRPGQYLSIGKQGIKRYGEVEAPSDLVPNPELTSAKAFSLQHSRPGTVSLAIAENDDVADRTLSPDYHPTQFLITTGPGPAPQLDNANVVFGRVLDGFSALAMLSEVRTYQPSSRVRAFNAFARAIGDERAEKVRQTWDRPIRPIVVKASRLLP